MQEDLGMTVSQSLYGHRLQPSAASCSSGLACAVVDPPLHQVGLIRITARSRDGDLFPVLLEARVAQGCFGALLAPTSQSLLNVTFTERN